MSLQLRRSLLFVPGDSDHKIDNGIASRADALILDLEDAVAPQKKEEARSVVRTALQQKDFHGKEHGVRINPFNTGLQEKDIRETLLGRPDFYVLPKVQGPEDVERVACLLDNLEPELGIALGKTQLIAIATETPQGVLEIKEIAFSSKRLTGIEWGQFDLGAAIGARQLFDENGELLEVFKLARSFALLAAKAAGIDAIDTVFEDFHDEAGLRREAQVASRMGFTGKAVIHPLQIDPVNGIFVPTDEEIAQAVDMMRAFQEQELAGRGTFTYKGQMVDAPQLKQAQKIVELAKASGKYAEGNYDFQL